MAQLLKKVNYFDEVGVSNLYGESANYEKVMSDFISVNSLNKDVLFTAVFVPRRSPIYQPLLDDLCRVYLNVGEVPKILLIGIIFTLPNTADI